MRRRLGDMQVLWNILTFPFRVVSKLLDIVGRAIVLVFGFGFMVLGIGAMVPLGKPIGFSLFFVGLLLVLRALA